MKVKGIVKKWRFPDASERQLRRSLQDSVKSLVELMRKKTKSMRFDATDQEITDAEEEVNEYAKYLALLLIGLLPKIGEAVYKFNSKQFVEVAKSTGGKDNNSVIVLSTLGATKGEQWYDTLYSEWMSMSENSINKFLYNVISDWSDNVRLANFNGKDSSQVNELLDKRYSVYKSWASNRATGVVGSWNSRLMRQRLYDAGVKSYFWNGMLDERERLKHLLLEGKEIPLNIKHIFPGEEYGCRCWAVPVWKRVKDEEKTKV